MAPAKREEKDSPWVWWRKAGSTIRVNGSSIAKNSGEHSSTPDFGVAIGEKEYTSGKHDVDFHINRTADNYVYGAHPSCPPPPACNTPPNSPGASRVIGQLGCTEL
jgi:hypothetical protein